MKKITLLILGIQLLISCTDIEKNSSYIAADSTKVDGEEPLITKSVMVNELHKLNEIDERGIKEANANDKHQVDSLKALKTHK